VSRRNVIPINQERHASAVEPMERALLPWEDREAFQTLRAAFHREHQPKGPTEVGLTDQLVWLEWRRQRLVVGERAAHMAALQDRLGTDYKGGETVRRAMIESGDKASKDELPPALSTTPQEDDEATADNDTDEAMTRRAIAILETGDPAGYDEAVAALRADTANWWEDVVSDDEQTHPDGQPHEGDSYQPYQRTLEQLLRFLRDEAMDIHAKTRGQLARRPALRLQAQGESVDPFRMNLLLTLDERLVRLFEKTLAMLLKLKELRSGKGSAQ
jgi:hypothetical protein